MPYIQSRSRMPYIQLSSRTSYIQSRSRTHHTQSRSSYCLLQVVFVLAALLSSFSSAQPPPIDSGLELQQQLPRQKYSHSFPTTVLDEQTTQRKPNPNTGNEARIFVKRYEFSGAIGSVITQAELSSLVLEFSQRHLSISELNLVASKISNFLRARGYLTSRAFLPPQDASDGTIKINIIVGEIDSDNGIVLNGSDLRLKPHVAKGVLSNALTSDSVVQRKNIERGVLLLRDLPGLTAAANLEAGRLPNTTRVLLDASEDELFTGGFSTSNSGSRLTGELRSVASFGLNNLSGYGDELLMSVQESLGSGENQYVFGQARVPVGYSGLKLSANGHYLDYEVGKEFKNIKSNGSALQFSLNMEYPIVRSSAKNLFIDLGMEYKKLRDSALGQATNHRELKIFNAGLFMNNVDDFFGSGYVEASAKLAIGDLDLTGLDISYFVDQSTLGAKTDGKYTRLSLAARRIQQLSEKTRLLVSLSGQLASGNLSTSEKMQLGGPTAVRAYPGGEGAGDNAVVANIEAQHTLWKDTKLGDIRFSGFYDWGRTRQYKNAENLVLSNANIYNLSGYGFSLSATDPSKYSAKLTVARRIGSNPAADPISGRDYDGSLHKTRVWLSLDIRF